MSTRLLSPVPALAAGLALASVAPAQDPVVRFEVSGAEADHSGFFAHSVAATDFAFVFGAPYDDATGLDSGAAYVYEVVGSVLEETARLTPAPGTSGAHFGSSVTVDGDTAIVGAPFDDGLAAGSGAGAAHVFVRTPAGWEPAALLAASDGAFGDELGHEVALSGDTAVVGAPGRDEAGPDSGAAYVFTRVGSAWYEEAKLTPVGGFPLQRFGSGLDVDGDVAVVGAPGESIALSAPGAAYVFERTAGTTGGWSQVATLQASDATGPNAFGRSVAVAGSRALVGAPLDAEQGAGAGACYVYDTQGTLLWQETAKLLPADGAPYDELGHDVALSGDRALVGAPYDDDEGPNSGAVYAFDHDGTGWLLGAKLTRDPGGASQNFGWTVAAHAGIAAVGVPGAEAFPDPPHGPIGWIEAPCWYDPNDCNGNGAKDWCDIRGGDSNDCDEDLVPDECQPHECRAEIVFVLDTSGSMCDESDTLCSDLTSLECLIYEQTGVYVETHFYTLTTNFSCAFADCGTMVTQTVLDEFGPNVPGNPGCCGNLVDCTGADNPGFSGPSENWGPATAIVADGFSWQWGAPRIVVPISDAAPWCGDPCYAPGGDQDVIDHAIGVALANDVRVCPMMGIGASGCATNLGSVIANGTGGTLLHTTDALGDLVDDLVAVISEDCDWEGPDVDPYCFGDGTGAPCPCGNDGGSGAGCGSSTGAGALLTATGSTSVAADDLVLTVGQVPPNQFGILFMGPGQLSGLPFGDGLICVSPSGGLATQDGIWRFPPASTGPLGTLVLGPGVAASAGSSFGASGQILPGNTWNLQGWYRDPGGACGGGFNLSNAVAVTFAP